LTCTKAAYRLKQRFLQKSNHSFLCPEDLSKMAYLENGEIICQRCGFSFQIQTIQHPSSFNCDISFIGLGSYRELKGFERFYQECLRELKYFGKL
jgi:hypothetical protein